MSDKKPEPLTPPRTQNRCPVCGEVSYSADGVHPQCSVRKADAQRLDRSKQNPTAKTTKPTSSIKSWQRLCPKCKKQQHVRKKVCDCGHSFAP